MKAKKQERAEIITTSIDQTEVLARVREIEADLAEVSARVEEVKIEDDEDYKAACTLLVRVVEQRKYVEEQRRGFLADVQKMLDRVEGWFSASFERLNDLDPRFRDAVAGYALALEEKAHGLRLAAARMKDESEAAGLWKDAEATHAPKVPGVSVTPRSRVDILDEAKLPAWAFKKVVDPKAVAAALERGEKVPGARLVVDMRVAVTPKNARGS